MQLRNSGPQLQSSGYNSRGNYYESYDDGSYHYENQDGSTYQCDANGHTTYTTPGGWVVESEGSDVGYEVGFAVRVEDGDDCEVAGYAVEAEGSHSDAGGGYGGGDDYEHDYGDDYGGGSDYGDDYDDDYDDDY